MTTLNLEFNGINEEGIKKMKFECQTLGIKLVIAQTGDVIDGREFMYGLGSDDSGSEPDGDESTFMETW